MKKETTLFSHKNNYKIKTKIPKFQYLSKQAKSKCVSISKIKWWKSFKRSNQQLKLKIFKLFKPKHNHKSKLTNKNKLVKNLLNLLSSVSIPKFNKISRLRNSKSQKDKKIKTKRKTLLKEWQKIKFPKEWAKLAI